MQRSGATPTTSTAPLFSSFNFSNGASRSRPGTSSGEPPSSTSFSQLQTPSTLQAPNVLTKERKGSYSRKSSFSGSPSKNGGSGGSGSAKRRANSSSVVTDSNVPPALPDFALAAAAKLSRETDAIHSPTNGEGFPKMIGVRPPVQNIYAAPLPPLPPVPGSSGSLQPSGQYQSEGGIVHQQVQDIANKRISTLDYLRKAHEGRVYWFNTLLFDKPELQRLPYFANPAKLARRATNYLLLGLSLPAVIDLNSNTPLEFLRSLNTLLQEFESFQQLHGENGVSSGSLSRARLPQMFRRTGGGKSRRATSGPNDIGLPIDDGSGNGVMNGSNSSVISFAAMDSELLPGEEYTHLLTPSLPFDPDFFETFATLCDVLIDTYQRILSLLPTPKECTAPVGELFAKADSKIKKIIIQGVVKEFEDNSRQQIRSEVANIGRVVLGGLM